MFWIVILSPSRQFITKNLACQIGIIADLMPINVEEAKLVGLIFFYIKKEGDRIELDQKFLSPKRTKGYDVLRQNLPYLSGERPLPV